MSNERRYNLESRTAEFGHRVVNFVRTIRQDAVTRPLITQLVRSATSVGANYAEAVDAQSRNDFRHILSICRKESRESIYWLNLLMKTKELPHEPGLIDEARQLNRIFGASIRTLEK